MKLSKSFALPLIEVHETTDNFTGVDTDFCLAGGGGGGGLFGRGGGGDIVVFAIEGMQ